MLDKHNPTVDEVIDIWCKKLESGDFNKGTCYLKRTINGCTNYCCLGILCEIYQENVGDLEITKTEYKSYLPGDGCYNFDEGNSYLPEKVRKWAKLNSIDGAYEENNTPKYIYHDNDCTVPEKTFSEISQIIKQNRATLFKE